MNTLARHELIAGSEEKIENYNKRLKTLNAKRYGLECAVLQWWDDEYLYKTLKADIRAIEVEEEALKAELEEFESYVEEERLKDLF